MLKYNNPTLKKIFIVSGNYVHNLSTNNLETEIFGLNDFISFNIMLKDNSERILYLNSYIPDYLNKKLYMGLKLDEEQLIGVEELAKFKIVYSLIRL